MSGTTFRSQFSRKASLYTIIHSSNASRSFFMFSCTFILHVRKSYKKKKKEKIGEKREAKARQNGTRRKKIVSSVAR